MILKKVIELVVIGVANLWGHFKDGVYWACDVVCGKKTERKSKGYVWWWNEEVKETISRHKNANKVM